VRLVEGGGQAILTATEPDHVPGCERAAEVVLARGAVEGRAERGQEAA
jgi:hypothetical protein